MMEDDVAVTRSRIGDESEVVWFWDLPRESCLFLSPCRTNGK